MLERVGVSWGDAEAERARARALDPEIEQRSTLPDPPDLQDDPLTEPYTRPIVVLGRPRSGAVTGDSAAAPPDSLATPEPDSLAAPPADPPDSEITTPRLLRYDPPTGAVTAEDHGDTLSAAAEPAGKLEVELVVDEDGVVQDVVIAECDRVPCETVAAVAFAAGRWRFSPATLDGVPVDVRIHLPVPLLREEGS